MTPPKENRSALAAWARSLPAAMLVPVLIWVVIVASIEPEHLWFGFLIAIYGMMVHFIAYALTGIPLFLYGFRYPRAVLWKLLFCVPFGIILGGLAFVLLLVISSGGDLGGISVGIVSVGCAYGLVTAISAYRCRPGRKPGPVMKSDWQNSGGAS